MANTQGSKPATEATLLEHFAGLAMQGYIAAGGDFDAAWSVASAKALLAELEKQQ
jgi:hypothetical protein